MPELLYLDVPCLAARPTCGKPHSRRVRVSPPAGSTALRTDLAQRNTKSLLVIRNDAIVCEWYAAGATADTKLGTASLAKAIVGGVSLAVALSDGRLNLDEPAAKFIPAWRGDPRKFRITLRQLGSHTSGIEDAEDGDKPHDKLTGWKGDFWKQLPVPDDPFTIGPRPRLARL